VRQESGSVFANLFPIGILQLADVVTNGYWHARSLEFFEQHAYLEWLRLPGDAAVIAGTLPWVYLTAKSVFRMRPQPVAPELAPVGGEGPRYTEVTAGSQG
jgi:nitric oxide reductase subunit B